MKPTRGTAAGKKIDLDLSISTPLVRPYIEVGCKFGIADNLAFQTTKLDLTYIGGTVKYVCFGYYDEKMWEAMPESEQNAFMDNCVAYDDVLRQNGQAVGGEALQSARNAKTLRLLNGKVMITDGPYAESKEQIGGFFLLEAWDMDEAVRLVSNHPGLKAGPFEIRQVEDMTEVVRASKRRRSNANVNA